MAGKYAHLINNLPRMLNTEPAYQEKVNIVKDAIKDEEVVMHGALYASKLGARYEQLRGDEASVTLITGDKIEALIAEFGKAGLEALLSEVNLRIEATSQLMLEQMEDEDLTSIRLTNGRHISTYYEPYGKVVDKEAFRQWCINNGLEKSLQLWPSTMNSITKQRLLEGQPEPDGVTAYAKPVIRMLKS